MQKLNKEFLDKISYPKDLRYFSKDKLPLICDELRQETIELVSQTGGHLGAGLGVIELTVALHYVFDTPKDKLVWDIGHQAYPHKILTGRRDKMLTLRKKDGLSGFTKREESEYDCYIGGHGGNSISAAIGMMVARDLDSLQHEVIAVIGDGSMSAGMAYEAMNNAGALQKRFILILNDNKMSIAPAVGALTTYLAKLISSKPYLSLRQQSKKILNKLPKYFKKIIKKFERNTKDLINDGNFFEEMGFYYLGPIDGHNVCEMVEILENIRNDQSINKPILLHVITEKGRGFEYSGQNCEEKYHAVSKFDIKNGVQQKSTDKTYTQVFSDKLIKLAEKDEKIVAITAAMPSGTGLNKFAEVFPSRMFDVGMAEQHAVSFAAGIACEKFKPYVALYSTFLQRAYDQVVIDVALQKLPVRFIIDRAGFVGADGPTHSGSYDLTYLSTLPGFVIMCPADALELEAMLEYSSLLDEGPSAIRFPRGNINILEVDLSAPINLGKGLLIQEGENIAVISLGTRLGEVLKAANELKDNHGKTITIINARFAKPIDAELILKIAKNHNHIITIEEGAIGGFSAQVNNILLNQGKNIINLFYPDEFYNQDSQDAMHDKACMNKEQLVELLLRL